MNSAMPARKCLFCEERDSSRYSPVCHYCDNSFPGSELSELRELKHEWINISRDDTEKDIKKKLTLLLICSVKVVDEFLQQGADEFQICIWDTHFVKKYFGMREILEVVRHYSLPRDITLRPPMLSVDEEDLASHEMWLITGKRKKID